MGQSVWNALCPTRRRFSEFLTFPDAIDPPPPLGRTAPGFPIDSVGTATAYQTTSSIAKIFFWFAIISILLTATGLFGLVSLTIVKKMKEIALRKVVGARSGHILLLVNRGYFLVFLIGAAIGCYGGYALTKLLLDMIFGVNAGIAASTLVNSVLVLFIIVAITSGFKVWQAVRTNPVKLLRTE